MKICGSKAGTKTELPDRNSIGRLQRFSKHAKGSGKRYSIAAAVRFQPVDNSTGAAGTPLIRIYGSA
jgi:hypothetical protein